MSYAAPAITSAGLSISSYSDILADNLEQYLAAYGQNAYLGPDTAIYQFISVLSLKHYDCTQGLQMNYTNRAPQSAMGAAMDSLFKLNGLARKAASYSTCPVTLSGTPRAVITDGFVSDSNGNQWQLPSPVMIGSGGTVTVTATCTELGAISAAAGTITNMAAGLTGGWTGVANAVAATAGQAVEADSAFRARQSVSQALPSQTRLAGTKAAIAAVPGVTLYNVFDNPTGTTDSFGTPAHSLTCVVQGGTDLAVATAIFNNCGIGCLTNGATPSEAGSTSVNVSDPNTGDVAAIGFYRPSIVPVYVSISVHGLAGWTTAFEAQIQAAVAAYLNSLAIGEPVVWSSLMQAALSVMPNASAPAFSIRALTSDVAASPTGTSDLAMNFYQVCSGVAANVVISVV